MNRFIFRLLPLAALAVAALGCSASQPISRGPYTSVPEENKSNWSVNVDSVLTRSDVTRLYVTLGGEPNRAGRIDSINVATVANKGVTGATDIDGIDFRRWFQWEEEGAIALEIDFPARTALRGEWTITLFTNLGPQTWIVSSPKRVVRKKK